MITLLLAWINSAYKTDYELLFIGTVIIDIKLINLLTTTI